MFKKLFSVATLGALLTSSAFGDDFLAKVSNGALSDNSAGVKVLNLNEMKDVKGGAFYHRLARLDNTRFQFWVASDGMYLTFSSITGQLKSNPDTDSVRNKMGFQGNGIVVVGLKDKYIPNSFYFALYDTKSQLPLNLIKPSMYNTYAQNEMRVFQLNAH
ncbi:hypothetical protein [Campylobacter aviculae]|uniref:Uncharacterized protein n=1 Tax=Campylobacter aviculae TaxID=2510190 RepID=A0A4U7BG26_9BACT|nr:hypothetical protein [Campylobacter aviculae]TKX30633.1 hypothetical protein CQA76_07790 [Campylobacter aviculae]